MFTSLMDAWNSIIALYVIYRLYVYMIDELYPIGIFTTTLRSIRHWTFIWIFFFKPYSFLL